jgi:hypothetical protein
MIFIVEIADLLMALPTNAPRLNAEGSLTSMFFLMHPVFESLPFNYGLKPLQL